MSTHPNLLGEPPPTLLPPSPEATKMLSEGKPAVEVAAAFPTFSLAWALLAELALEGDRFVEAYAYARTGYHRGLDALRRNGWKGHGPIPWSHEPNRGFLRCLAALARAAGEIGEMDEADRCWTFLADSSLEGFESLKKLSRTDRLPRGQRPRCPPGVANGPFEMKNLVFEALISDACRPSSDPGRPGSPGRSCPTRPPCPRNAGRRPSCCRPRRRP
jgi:hypothetical protein